MSASEQRIAPLAPRDDLATDQSVIGGSSAPTSTNAGSVASVDEECAAAAYPGAPPQGSDDCQWEMLLAREDSRRLSDIAQAIGMRRTVEEAELAIKLERDFRADPSILQDIDFRAIATRLRADREINDGRLVAMFDQDGIADLRSRQEQADIALQDLIPEYSDRSEVSVVAVVPKLRRVISQARELPLAVELPKTIVSTEGVDIQAALKESRNLAAAAKQVWQRLNGNDASKEEELIALQKESKALLSMRAEATKLRAGIGLLQRQKELKRKALIRYDSDALLEETLRADVSIMRLQKELSLKAALLEMERIFLVLEADLLSSSLLTDQLLPMVRQYGVVEVNIRGMVRQVQANSHAAIDEARLVEVEREIADLLLNLGLQTPEQEPFSWRSSREAFAVNLNKAKQGVAFYVRGAQLFGKDVQLLVNMLARAILQGYTLRSREVKLLRRIAKDMFTIIPFVIILIIPLTPLGHVLVFSFIQRFFPDFFPSQFTESRQQIMSMYSSLTTPGVPGVTAVDPVADEDSRAAPPAPPPLAGRVESEPARSNAEV